jgi:hypothetical protein
MVGPIEELGGRGVALPLLQRQFASLYSAVIPGVVSALWRTPAFLMSGSLLVALVFNAHMNGPEWPDTQPWDMIGFVLVAIALAFVQRRMLLDRGSAATAVLEPPESTAADRDARR